MNEVIGYIITAVGIPLLTVISGYIIAFIKAKTAVLTQNNKFNQYQNYIYMASETVQNVVSAVFQSYVSTLKKEGKWDKDAQCTAFKMAKSQCYSILGDAAKEAIEELYGDVGKWLDTTIEHKVLQNKSYSGIFAIPNTPVNP